MWSLRRRLACRRQGMLRAGATTLGMTGQAGDIRSALERALAANQAGQPAVVEFVVGPWDYSWGFKDYYRRLGELPGGMEAG